MKLEVDRAIAVHHPSPEDLEQAFERAAEGNVRIVLRAADGAFVRFDARRRALECGRPGALERATARRFIADPRVLETFLLFAAGRRAWKRHYEWKEIKGPVRFALPSVRPCYLWLGLAAIVILLQALLAF